VVAAANRLSARRAAEFVFRRTSVPIFVLLAGVAAVISAIAAGSVTWKAVWIGVASSCLTGGLVDGSAVLEARRRDRAILRVAGMRVGYFHQRLLWIIDAVFCVSGEPSDVGDALRDLLGMQTTEAGRFEQLDTALRQNRFYAWLKSGAPAPEFLDEYPSLASGAADVLDAVQTQFRFFAGLSGRSWRYGQLASTRAGKAW
jgi:hypothetical protein